MSFNLPKDKITHMSLIPSASLRTVIRIVVSKALQQSIFLVIGVVVVVALIVVATSACVVVAVII